LLQRIDGHTGDGFDWGFVRGNRNESPIAQTVAAQHYDTDINKEYVIRGNAAILKCVLPSYLSDYLEIVSWKVDDEEMNYSNTNYGTTWLQHASPSSAFPFTHFVCF